MKKLEKFFGSMFLAAIICYSLFVFPSATCHSTIENNIKPNQENQLYAVSLNLFSISAEEVINAAAKTSNFPFQTSKNFGNKLEATSTNIESVFKSKFFQYLLNSKDILIEKRKSELIFPYHYFW